ncbi:hypothetical protein LWI28_028678 [Acer negundo]|uniref:NAD(P)-binding domain-containing protein n=1 Tax=Acer negundo TaxID=4023 RepID=A0AAD5JEH4_ACENE|nr:hypothetical protein LWI28_028678 [Acer negundo]
MATELFFSPIPDLPCPLEKFPKHPHRLPLFALPPLTVSSWCSRFKNISSSKFKSSSVINALREEVIQTPKSDPRNNPSPSSKLVLVIGGSGGVGQLVVASLLRRNIKSRLLVRDPEKVSSLFGEQDEETLQVYTGDTRNPKDLDPSIFEGVTHVICCTGTTAFPSKRWDGDNTPEKVDWEGVRNLVSALPSSVKRIVLVSSVGVTKFNELPWSIMNLFGVLKYKKMGEDFVRKSGLPFTIIRPGRLTDGPYTSYDLNTLLKATAGKRRAVVIGQGDKLVGEAKSMKSTRLREKVQEVILRSGESYLKLPDPSDRTHTFCQVNEKQTLK